MQKIFSIYIIFFVAFSNLAAQENAYEFLRYGIEEGLSQATVRDILQDKRGFWWFGTANGLNRFDGHNFHYYYHHHADEKSITSGDIYSLYLDGQGDIWAFTSAGFSKYLHAEDHFFTPKPQRQAAIGAFSETPEHHIWMYDSRGNTFLINNIKGNTIQFSAAPYYDLECKVVAYSNTLYRFSTLGICSFDAINEKWRKFSSFSKELKEMSAGVAFDHKLYLGTQQGKLLVCDSILNIKATYKICDIPIKKVLKYNDGFMCATENGLYYFNQKTLKTTVIRYDANSNKSLSNNNIISLATDNIHTLWVGTKAGGLNYLIPNSPKFKLIPSNSYYQIRSFYKKNNSSLLYCGVALKGVDVYDLNNPNMPPKVFQIDKHIVKILPYKENELLVFWRKGLFIISTQSSTIKKVEGELTNPKYWNYTAMWKQNDDSILVACNKRLYWLHQLQNFTPFSSAEMKSEITWLLPNTQKKGVFWVGTVNGLFEVNEKGQQEVIIDKIHVKHLMSTQDGHLWVSSTTGLYELNTDYDIKQYNNESYGLADDYVYSAVVGAGNVIWVSHNQGLSRLNSARNVFKNFSLKDNLQGREFNTGAVLGTPDGTIIFGGVSGINYFNSNDFFDNPITPIPIITNIRVNDVDYQPDTVIWEKKQLILKSYENTISFEFSGLQFTPLNSSQFFYQMEGIDKKWLFAGKRRFARYPRLEPGRYTFRVRATNDDGNESAKIASFIIEITTPFYKRTWFLVFLGLGFVVSAMGVIYLIQQRRYRKKMRELEIFKRVRSERERISRDLHDNIGSQITYLITSMDWAKKQLSPENELLQQRLTNLKTNAQNMMSSIRDTIWALNKEEITVQDFADRLRQYAIYHIKDHTTINLVYSENINSNHTLGSDTVLNLFRIAQEVIQNIIKHSKAKSVEINVACHTDDILYLALKDDGVGFDIDKLDTEGFGLENIKYRANEIGATIKIEASPNHGTTFSLQIHL